MSVLEMFFRKQRGKFFASRFIIFLFFGHEYNIFILVDLYLFILTINYFFLFWKNVDWAMYAHLLAVKTFLAVKIKYGIIKSPCMIPYPLICFFALWIPPFILLSSILIVLSVLKLTDNKVSKSYYQDTVNNIRHEWQNPSYVSDRLHIPQ